ncbi:PAS domain-containing protein [Candidatus Reidiella endopervernicosa]|uniref:PAS domain-containing protein n=1 Tax=Candidatus Reidiella endopervernicosa TaxID=2738883 RepID=UPI003B968FB0
MAQTGSWSLDLKSGELEWSDEIFNIFEIDPKQFGASYEAFLNTVHPDDRKQVNEAYNKSVKERHHYQIEHRLLMSNGRIKHVQERGRTRYSESGEPLLSVGTVQDITDKRDRRAPKTVGHGF